MVRIFVLCASAVYLQASEPISAQVCYNITLNKFCVYLDREKGTADFGARGRRKTYCSRKEGPAYCR